MALHQSIQPWDTVFGSAQAAQRKRVPGTMVSEYAALRKLPEQYPQTFAADLGQYAGTFRHPAYGRLTIVAGSDAGNTRSNGTLFCLANGGKKEMSRSVRTGSSLAPSPTTPLTQP